MIGTPTLVDLVKQEVLTALAPYLSGGSSAALESLVTASIMKAVQTFRSTSGNRAMYAGSLGSFILEQNPYTTAENLILPNLPVNPAGQNKWVRKSGVLAENDASRPLARDKPIPGGMVVNFSYEDWEYLRDLEEKKGPPVIPTGFTLAPGEKDPLAAPESDPPNTDTLPADLTTYYGHNIVKSVRLKYRYLDRFYPPTGPVAEKQRKRDVHTGYILIQYSGTDI